MGNNSSSPTSSRQEQEEISRPGSIASRQALRSILEAELLQLMETLN